MRKQFPPKTTCPACGSDRKSAAPQDKYEECSCGFVFDFNKALKDASKRFPIVHSKLGSE